MYRLISKFLLNSLVSKPHRRFNKHRNLYRPHLLSNIEARLARGVLTDRTCRVYKLSSSLPVRSTFGLYGTRDDNDDVDDEDHGRNNPISNFALDRCISLELQAESTIDSANEYQGATMPDMCHRPRSSRECASVDKVVNQAHSGLEDEEGDDDKANNRVNRVELLKGI